MSARQGLEHGFAMPRFGPLYSEPPYVYAGNRIVNVTARTTPEVLRALVPGPLTPNPDGLLFVYVADFHVVAPVEFRYKEAGVGVPVALGDHPGQYGVVLYLDHTGGIVAGREIYGFPKKEAEITFDEEDDAPAAGGRIAARVTRNGVVLIDAAVHPSARVDPIPAQEPVPWYNLKLIPSVRKGAPPEVMQLTSTLTEDDTETLYRGPATLAFGTAYGDPLGDIPILEILQGEFSTGGMTLGFGDVAHDYLAEAGSAST